nr:protein FAR1-RELATED SEQUENCE 5-like [Ipomoea batatas]
MDSASGGCDERYSTDIGVEVSACDMEISPGMTKYWRPICANSLKPHVGQQFDSLDSAFGFYKQYAGSVGFDCRQSTTRKGRDGGIVLKHVSHSSGNCPLNVSIWRMRNTPQSTLFLLSLQDIFILFSVNFAIFSDFSDFLRSFSCPRYLFTYFCFTSINIHFNSISFLSLLTITIFSGYSIDVIPTMVLLFLRHLGYPSMRPPLERMSEGAVSTRVDILSSAVAMVLMVLVISSTKSFWGSVPAALVGVGHQLVESMDLLLQQLECPRSEGWVASWHMITSRAKCLLNQGSPASVSNILVIIALGVMHAVVFSKIALHSRRISRTALAARLVISICPIGSPRVTATSAAVIWIDCPFWSCKSQDFTSQRSLAIAAVLRGNPMSSHSAVISYRQGPRFKRTTPTRYPERGPAQI